MPQDSGHAFCRCAMTESLSLFYIFGRNINDSHYYYNWTWGSLGMRITGHEDHCAYRSPDMSITWHEDHWHEDHWAWGSLDMRITEHEDHWAWASLGMRILGMRITEHEDHWAWGSQNMRILGMRITGHEHDRTWESLAWGSLSINITWNGKWFWCSVIIMPYSIKTIKTIFYNFFLNFFTKSNLSRS